MTCEQVREHIQRGGKIKVTTLEALAELQQQLAGMVIHAMVLHDEECTPTWCCCSPHFEVELATAENVLEGERRQKGWIQKTCS